MLLVTLVALAQLNFILSAVLQTSLNVNSWIPEAGIMSLVFWIHDTLPLTSV